MGGGGAQDQLHVVELRAQPIVTRWKEAWSRAREGRLDKRELISVYTHFHTEASNLVKLQAFAGAQETCRRAWFGITSSPTRYSGDTEKWYYAKGPNISGRYLVCAKQVEGARSGANPHYSRLHAGSLLRQRMHTRHSVWKASGHK